MQGCNQYVTVWNKWHDPNNTQSPDIFYRHILPVRCKYKTKAVRNATDKGAVISNSQQVIIPVTDMYKSPNEWVVMSEEDREKYFTLQIDDIMALGAILFDITGKAPWRETDIRQRLRPEIFTIKVVQNNTRDRRGKHFKVEGT